MSKLGLPKKDAEPAISSKPEAAALDMASTRKDVVLALVPVVAKHGLLNPQSIVEIATHLCEYIHTGRKQDTSQTSSASGGPGCSD